MRIPAVPVLLVVALAALVVAGILRGAVGLGVLVAAVVLAAPAGAARWVVRGQRRDLASAARSQEAESLAAQALWAGGAQLATPDLSRMKPYQFVRSYRSFAGGVLVVLPSRLVFLPGDTSRRFGAERREWATGDLRAVFAGPPQGPGRRSAVVVQSQRGVLRYQVNNAQGLPAAIDEAGLPRVGTDGQPVRG